MTQEMLIVSVLAGVLFLYLLYRQRLLTLEFLRLKKKIGSAPAQGAGPNGQLTGDGHEPGSGRAVKAGTAAPAGEEAGLVAALCAAIAAYRAAEAAAPAQGDSPGFVIRRIRRLR